MVPRMKINIITYKSYYAEGYRNLWALYFELFSKASEEPIQCKFSRRICTDIGLWNAPYIRKDTWVKYGLNKYEQVKACELPWQAALL